MIIKIEENIKSLSSWMNMVKANAEKIKGFGATIIFAGVSKEDPTKFTVIVKYATMEGFEAFKNDKELHAARAEAVSVGDTCKEIGSNTVVQTMRMKL
jgi:heme-degrading monooxygenase HmoA